MKNTSTRMKISVLTAVSALALSGVAFGSSAFATETATATATGTATATATAAPTISPMTGGSTLDLELSDESDVQGILDGIQSTLGVSVGQGDQQDGTVDAQESDNGVDATNNENTQEQASFSDDISAAVQAGDNEDAAQLSTAASIVAAVTVPEVKAMASDDAEAHAMITGVPQN